MLPIGLSFILKTMFRHRFAPSPTGEMHLGNARTALLAWLQARANNGKFILRLEDLDTSRIRFSAADQILRDLAWLGLDWDEGWDIGGAFAPYIQSERTALYTQYAAQLETYACSCSRKDIQNVVSAPHNSEPRYAGTCRSRTSHTRATALRYRVPDLEIEFTDGICGQQLENVQKTIGDFVIRRNDGAWAYQLACVVDDIEMQITDVLRGQDLLSSTARQIMLYKALNKKAPRFYHVPLLTDFRGQRLAKRDHALSLKTLRETGIDPTALTRDLAQSLGWKVKSPCYPKDLLETFNNWIFAQPLGESSG
jgi:glutamyl-tRNA synthetase